MTKKKALILILAVLLCLTAGALSACDEKETLPIVAPVAWETYLDEVAGMLADDIVRDSDSVSLSLNGNISGAGTAYDVFAAVSYDLKNIDNSLMVVEVKNGRKNVFSIKSDNKSSYVDIAPNSFIGDAKLKLENTGLFSFLSIKYNPGSIDSAAQALKSFFVNLGGMLFDGVDVNADKTEYIFSVSDKLWKEKSAEYFDALTSIFDDNTMNLILGLFKAESKEDLLLSLPSIEGEVRFSASEGKITSINSDSFLIGNGDSYSFDFEIEITDSLTPSLKDRFPADDKGYKVTKVGNSQISGVMSLTDTAWNRRAASFDFELNVNMDLLKLALNDYDLSSLSDDNYFHFRLSHKCDSYCTEFCRSKLGFGRDKINGAIIDVAFSPKDFGNYNIFINLNMQALISTDYLNRINEYPSEVTLYTVPDYCLITVPYEKFYKNSPFEELFSMFYGGMIMNESSFSLDADTVVDCLAPSPFFAEILTNSLVSEDFDNDLFRFRIDKSLYGQADPYDVYTQTVYIIANDEPKTKEYTQLVMRNDSYIALGWIFEDAKEDVNGEIFNNIYDGDGNIVHGVDADGAHVPMSPQEADNLIGKYVGLSYTGLDKTQMSGAYGKIVDVSGLDIKKIGETQDVMLTVEYPNAFDYIYLGALFGKYDSMFTDTLEVKIKLDIATDVAFSQNFSPDTEFKMVTDSGEMPEFLKGSVTTSYINGYVKKIDVVGYSDSVLWKYFLIPGLLDRYSIINWGEIKVAFDLVTGTEYRTYRIKKPDEISFAINEERISAEVGEYYYPSRIDAKMTARYNGDEEPVNVKLQFKDYYINDISLGQSSSDWTYYKYLKFDSERIVFNKSNSYLVQIKKQDVLSEVFTLNVYPKQTPVAEYQFTDTTDTPKFYLTGKEYIFMGSLSNSLHGSVSDTMKTFNVNVYKGKLNSKDDLSFNSPALTDAEIYKRIAINSRLDSDMNITPYLHNVPAIIKDTFNIYIKVKFDTPGWYKVEFVMSGGNSETVKNIWEVYVSENPPAGI